MLSLAQVKELVGDPNLDDAEAEALRDAARRWAELVWEACLHETRKPDSTDGDPKTTRAPNGA